MSTGRGWGADDGVKSGFRSALAGARRRGAGKVYDRRWDDELGKSPSFHRYSRRSLLAYDAAQHLFRECDTGLIKAQTNVQPDERPSRPLKEPPGCACQRVGRVGRLVLVGARFQNST